MQLSRGSISYFKSHKRKKKAAKKKYIFRQLRSRLGRCCVELPYGNVFGGGIWNQFPFAAVIANKVNNSVPKQSSTRLTVFSLSLSEAVARHSIPRNHASKSNVNGAKKSFVKVPEKVHIRSKIPYPHKKTFFKAGPGLEDSEMEVIGHVTKKRKRSESKKRKKRKRHLNV